MKIDLSTLQPYIDEKLISVQKHPTDELYIYNYTQKAQFKGEWTPELLMCRGLILDNEGNVIARPFDKFFNLTEHPEKIPLGVKFRAFDKADGSLGIMYQDSTGKYCLATRGSFTSDQAIKGTEMLQDFIAKKGGPSYPTLTYLFEIIYPENRIVINYYGESKLIPLGARDIETGEIFPAGKEVQDYDIPRDNAEGVVLYYDNGFMCKVKYEEYVRLHRLVTGVSARTIWDLLRNNQPFDELLERVPDEFYDWVKETKKSLEYQFQVIEMECADILKDVKDLPTRREQAIEIMSDPRSWSGVVFAMLDKKNYQEIIWKLIKPKANKPFKEDEL